MTARILGQKNYFSIPKTIWVLGFMTLLMNFSTIIVFSLSPIYLTQVFGASCFAIGFLEGFVEFLSLMTRIFAGLITDALSKRKPLLVIAAGFTSIARLMFPMAPTMEWIFVSRSLDRVANGLQATPREALIGDYAPREKRGASYGLRESLGKIGAFLGAGLIFFLLSQHILELKMILWCAAIPTVFALVLIVWAIYDKPHSQVKREVLFSLDKLLSLSKDYWFVVLISSLFMLSNYSGAFLILKGKKVTGEDSIAPLIMIAQNGAAMLAAYPLGRMFDVLNHKRILAVGFAIVIVANIILAAATTQNEIIVGSMLWGIQLAMTQSLLSAKIAEHSKSYNRGTAFALYYLAIGVSIFASNGVFGKLTDLLDIKYGFFFSAAVAGVAFFFLPLLKKAHEN